MLADQWEDYAAKIMPANAPPTQRTETRRAFYAGAAACFYTINSFLGDGFEPTDDEVQMVEEMVQEIESFIASVGTAEEFKDRRSS